MDGVPFVTQKPFAPGESFTYEFTANRPGSLMYHSHHNATDQVGRGLLGAFIVDPKKPTADDAYDRDYIWISNDVLGGFTINGHGFPAVVPILAAVGETVRVRFMNEGIMYHPFHSHGYKMKVVARDGYPLGQNAYDADTISVGPGERWDVNITADRAGRLGVPLPHPPPRRGRGRHVRHGEHAVRRARRPRHRRDRPAAAGLATTMTAVPTTPDPEPGAPPVSARPARPAARRSPPLATDLCEASRPRPTRRSTWPPGSGRRCSSCR